MLASALEIPQNRVILGQLEMNEHVERRVDSRVHAPGILGRLGALNGDGGRALALEVFPQTGHDDHQSIVAMLCQNALGLEGQHTHSVIEVE